LLDELGEEREPVRATGGDDDREGWDKQILVEGVKARRRDSRATSRERVYCKVAIEQSVRFFILIAANQLRELEGRDAGEVDVRVVAAGDGDANAGAIDIAEGLDRRIGGNDVGIGDNQVRGTDL